MRKIILSLLMAGAAASPAIAQDHGRWQQDEAQGDRQQAREERQQAREERQQARAEVREQRSGGGDVAAPMQQPSFEPAPRGDVRQDAQGQFDGRRFGGRSEIQADVQAPQPQPQRQFEGRPARGDFRGTMRNDGEQAGVQRWTGTEDRWSRRGGDLRQSDRPLPNVMRDPNPLIVSNTPREGTQPPPVRTETRRYAGTNWSTSWRNSSRYDWRRWRDRHRSTFRVGIYYDPFGWNYRPYSIGWRLWPSYYSRNYWINDPWQYRLPYAPPGTVWVRYWDDALLVDRWSGEVIDVIHNFFW